METIEVFVRSISLSYIILCIISFIGGILVFKLFKNKRNDSIYATFSLGITSFILSLILLILFITISIFLVFTGIEAGTFQTLLLITLTIMIISFILGVLGIITNTNNKSRRFAKIGIIVSSITAIILSLILISVEVFSNADIFFNYLIPIIILFSLGILVSYLYEKSKLGLGITSLIVLALALFTPVFITIIQQFLPDGIFIDGRYIPYDNDRILINVGSSSILFNYSTLKYIFAAIAAILAIISLITSSKNTRNKVYAIITLSTITAFILIVLLLILLAIILEPIMPRV